MKGESWLNDGAEKGRCVCAQHTNWNGSKARNNGGGVNLDYTASDGGS